MSKNKHQSSTKTRRRWPWIVLLCLIGLIGLVRLSLMTAPIQNWVKSLVVDTANNQLNPMLSIGELSGDLWNSVTLTNIKLVKGDTLASVDTLHVEYSPLSYFSDVFKIHEVRIVKPFLKIEQQADSTWNVQHWMKTAPDTATTDSSGTFAFSISSLMISRGKIDAKTMQLPDSSFVIDEMNIRAGLAMLEDGYRASVEELSLKVKNTPLGGPVSLNAASEASSEQITLEKLAIATARSLLEASGKANFKDSTLTARAQARPLSWKDMAAVMDSVPMRKDLNLSLEVKGNTNQFDINLESNAAGIDQFRLSSTIQQDTTFTLTSLKASAKELNLQTFMGDTSMPRMHNLKFEAKGNIPLSDYQQARMTGTLSISDIRQSGYRLDKLQGQVKLIDGHANFHLEPLNGPDRIIADFDASRIWSEKPSVTARFRGSNINPQNWIPDTSLTGSLSFTGNVSGTGWFPEQDTWTYRLSVNNSSLNSQEIDKATFSGRFNRQMATNESQIIVADSKLRLQAELQELQAIPRFSYALSTENLDVADISGFDEYSSSLNLNIKGSGQGNSLDNLKLQTTAKMDSSRMMGEIIQNLTAAVRVDRSIASVDSLTFVSGIADANMNGRIFLQDFYDSESSMNLNVELKDLSSFAPVAGADILLATGSIAGSLKPAGLDSLIFNGDLDLQNVNYNNQFIADQIGGSVFVELKNNPKYDVHLNISQPNMASVPFQNFSFNTAGQWAENTKKGSYKIALAGEDEGSINQAGSYEVGTDLISLDITKFDFTSSLRTLSLQEPFHATFAGGVVQTDTLRIGSEDRSAFLELAIPFADSLQQQVYFEAEKLDLIVLQDAILNERYIEGLLSGGAKLERSDSGLTASGDILMSQLVYNETKLDTLQFTAQIDNERLTGDIQLFEGGELLVEGAADVPFSSKKPTELSDAFFEQPVSGHLRIREVELSRFSNLLEQAGYENTNGALQFNAQLKGKAGQPAFNADMSLKNARLSGVPIDSLVANVNYQHSESQLNLDASLTSLKKQAMVVDAVMPFNVDLRELSIALPGPQDSISIAVETNELNLEAFNDFLDPAMARNLEGRLDGKVDISGPRNDLLTSGKLEISKGAVRVVTAGIRVDNIKSTILIQPGEVVLENLRMKSGKGSLNAKGTLALEQLVPGDINFKVKAENFKAANTKSYNGIIGMDMNLGGSINKPSISGEIDVINGFVELDNFGEKSVEQVSLDTTLTPEIQTSLYDSLNLDLDVQFNKRFFIRNERYLEMEIELDGQLDILKKTTEGLQLFGTLTTADGYARPLGKRFELEEGTLAFSGPPDNPQINIRTLYEPRQAEQDIKIWYTIEGTVEDPQFKYESEPPMDLAGIISYTLFGQPFYNLNPAEQSVASSSSNNVAADFAVEVLLDRVEAIATQRLGIDVVRIEQTRVGGDSGTSVTTGWYINPKVFFAIQNVITGSTPTTGFYLEYYLRENLKLILSQANDNRQGVDLQWEYDY